MDTVVYDKGKYHLESVLEFGLPEEQASVHTAFFVGWLLETEHMSEEFQEDFAGEYLEDYKARNITALEIYGDWDTALVDDMLNDEGNAFAQYYFDFETGAYLDDYRNLLVGDLPSEFHVLYTWENQAAMSAKISERFREWQSRVPTG